MSSAGAIALAEFLPESTSLLHLDLTNNNLDLAGVMALSSGLKANHTMRCLDVNIPPGNEEFAKYVHEISSASQSLTFRAGSAETFSIRVSGTPKTLKEPLEPQTGRCQVAEVQAKVSGT